MATAWLALLAPLPHDARAVRHPVLPEELRATSPDSPVIGWTSVVLHQSVLTEGLRTVMATLDAEGRLLSGSDLVHLEIPGGYQQHSLGGRFELDGSFRGTRWDGTAAQTEDRETADWNLVRSEPAPGEVARLRELIAELLRLPVDPS